MVQDGCHFWIIAFGGAISGTVSYVPLQWFRNELMLYFECEQSGELYCDRNDFEKFTNPTAQTLRYTLPALYSVITLYCSSSELSTSHN